MLLADIVQAVQDDVSDATTTIPVVKINRYVSRALKDVQRELIIHGIVEQIDGLSNVISWLATGGTYTNNLNITNVAPSVATSASYTFLSTDVGNILRLTAGTNIVPGRYQIASVTGGAATLDRNGMSGAPAANASGYLGKSRTLITTDGTTTAYPLLTTDPIMITSVSQVDSTGAELCPAEQIDKKDRFEYSVWDENRQCWRYWLTRNSNTGDWLINFNGSPSSGTIFSVAYVVEDVSDANVLLAIPSQYHELVVAKATLGLFGPDPSLGAFAAARYSELRRQMLSLTSSRAGSNEVIRDG